MATHGAPAISAQVRLRLPALPSWRAAFAAVIHSNRCRRVISTRARLVATAPSIWTASNGRKTTASSQRSPLSFNERSDCRQTHQLGRLQRVSVRRSTPELPGPASRAAVQTQAAPGKPNQPATSNSSKAGGSKLRRRLSSSFQVSMTPKPAVICCRPVSGPVGGRAATTRARVASHRESSGVAGACRSDRTAGSLRRQALQGGEDGRLHQLAGAQGVLHPLAREGAGEDLRDQRSRWTSGSGHTRPAAVTNARPPTTRPPATSGSVRPDRRGDSPSRPASSGNPSGYARQPRARRDGGPRPPTGSPGR